MKACYATSCSRVCSYFGSAVYTVAPLCIKWTRCNLYSISMLTVSTQCPIRAVWPNFPTASLFCFTFVAIPAKIHIHIRTLPRTFFILRYTTATFEQIQWVLGLQQSAKPSFRLRQVACIGLLFRLGILKGDYSTPYFHSFCQFDIKEQSNIKSGRKKEELSETRLRVQTSCRSDDRWGQGQTKAYKDLNTAQVCCEYHKSQQPRHFQRWLSDLDQATVHSVFLLCIYL